MLAPLDEHEQRELLATACHILYRLGLSDYLGHPSVRLDDERVLIKPKHSPRITGMDSMHAEDMILIDLDGEALSGDDGPPSERFIHTEIYKMRPDVRSVVHTHQPMATLLGIVGLPILPLLHVESAVVEQQPVPTFSCAELIVNQDLGQRVALALGSHKVCHLQGHGIVSVAESVQGATLGAIHLERLAEVNYRAAQLGREPRVIPPNELAALKQQLASPAGRWAYYAEMTRR
ncbi:MAG: class II aldolase/adducin family protein [Chloroflexi bacterium]|nr:class II aldolase/adducin family protein [Chloroflexota bacterium]